MSMEGTRPGLGQWGQGTMVESGDTWPLASVRCQDMIVLYFQLSNCDFI